MLSTLTVDLLQQGVQLSALHQARAGAPRVLLLHGFPEAGFIWEPIMQALAEEADLLAPTLRGYAPSSRPSDPAAYKPRALVADLVALIERQGAPMDLVVAHDWGGALAWNLAAQHPQCLKRLLIVNAPHPALFLRALRDDPAQQAASAYMNALCEPGAAERLAAHDFAGLWPFFEAHSPSAGHAGGWLTPALRTRYRALWSASLPTMLQWYRASPLKPPQRADDPVMSLQLPPELTRVSVPTWVLWGEADQALPPSLLAGLASHVPVLQVERVAGASHWIVHERPDRVVAAIRRALAAA